MLRGGRASKRARQNIQGFAKREFHFPYDSGMHILIKAFYKSIEDDTPPPIPYAEILRTSRIMDRIFDQAQAAMPHR